MQKSKKALLGVLGCLLCIFGCSDSKKNETQPYDPQKPIGITEFLPDSGGIRTKFIIKGENFGIDKEKIKVFFDEKEALVLAVNHDVIYTMVPKLEGGETNLKLRVEDQEFEYTEKLFNYIVASSVSTVVGKAKESGNKDGTIGETTFVGPRHVAVDKDNNLFVVDAGSSRLRLISIDKNKSITLFDKTLLGQMAYVNAERSQIISLGDGDQSLYLFDAETGWVPEVLGKVASPGAWIHSVIISPDESHIITRINTGKLIAVPFDGGKGVKPEHAKELGEVKQVNGGQNGHLVYNPVDGYYYCATHRDNVIWRIKIGPEFTAATTVIEPFIANGLGYEDGPLSSAKFNTPKGMAVDSEGFLYVADEGNNRIRKIDTKNGIVSTVAGNGSRGYKDGDPLDAEFNAPQGVCVDINDFIYIADSGNHCVRKLAIE